MTPQSPKEALPGRVFVYRLLDGKPRPAVSATVPDPNLLPPFPGVAYYSESALAEAVRKGKRQAFEDAAKEVDSWLDLLEIDHRDILAKQQYKDPQEAGREYRNKCNLLGAVRASILKLSAAALSVPGEEGEKNGKE